MSAHTPYDPFAHTSTNIADFADRNDAGGIVNLRGAPRRLAVQPIGVEDGAPIGEHFLRRACEVVP